MHKPWPRTRARTGNGYEARAASQVELYQSTVVFPQIGATMIVVVETATKVDKPRASRQLNNAPAARQTVRRRTMTLAMDREAEDLDQIEDLHQRVLTPA